MRAGPTMPRVIATIHAPYLQIAIELSHRYCRYLCTKIAYLYLMLELEYVSRVSEDVVMQ